MKPRDTVEGYLKAMESMDFSQGLQFISPEVEYINSPDTRVSGHAGVLAVLEPFFDPIEENEFQVLQVISEGDCVFVERLDRHRIGNEWFELPVAGVFRVEAGKIVYWREYFDLSTVQQDMQRILGGKA